MTGTVVVLAAQGSAVAAATSTVLQHRAAHRAPGSGAGRLLWHLLTNPAWIAGLLAGVAGLVLHVVALSAGQLVVVQPLLMSGMLFALPLSVVLEGTRPAVQDWLLALVLVLALAVFLLSANPSGGAAAARTGALLTYSAGTLAVMAVLGVAGSHGPPARRAALLGAAGGIGFGLTAALVKQATAVAASPRALAGSWCGYAVLAVGILSIAVTQLAYRAGPLATSLPALTISDPVAAIVLGVLAFGERLDNRPAALAVAAGAFVVMAVAAAVLARRSAAPPSTAEPSPPARVAVR